MICLHRIPTLYPNLRQVWYVFCIVWPIIDAMVAYATPCASSNVGKIHMFVGSYHCMTNVEAAQNRLKWIDFLDKSCFPVHFQFSGQSMNLSNLCLYILIPTYLSVIYPRTVSNYQSIYHTSCMYIYIYTHTLWYYNILQIHVYIYTHT